MLYEYTIEDCETGEKLCGGFGSIDTIKQRLWARRPDPGYGHDKDDHKMKITYPDDQNNGMIVLDWFGVPDDVVAIFY